jgi:glucose/arabinose dehydrogenase
MKLRITTVVALFAATAFAGVGLAGPIETTGSSPKEASFRQVVVVEGLDRPWSFAWLADGTMLVTEKPGRLRVVRDGKLDPTPVAGLPTDIFAGGQGGLFEVSPHPKFAENKLLYISYSAGTNTANRTTLIRGEFDGKALSKVEKLFEVSQPKRGGQHFGGKIVWLPDGTLLLSIGDGGNPPASIDGDLSRKQAQNPKSQIGKVVHLKDDGKPVGKPAFSQDGAEMVFTMGHRNIQGMARDPVSGRIYATEHGARGGDEFNELKAGSNYGWPVVTYSVEYSGKVITEERSRPEFADPLVAWVPSPAPSGLVIYQGDKFPAWKGDALSGNLAGQHIRRIDLDEKGNVIGQTMLEIGQRVRDVREGPDGYVYLCTDEATGKVVRLEPK